MPEEFAAASASHILPKRHQHVRETIEIMRRREDRFELGVAVDAVPHATEIDVLETAGIERIVLRPHGPGDATTQLRTLADRLGMPRAHA